MNMEQQKKTDKVKKLQEILNQLELEPRKN